MGTKDQTAGAGAPTTTAAATTTTLNEAPQQFEQNQQQQELQHIKLPKASAAPRVIIIPAAAGENEASNTTTTTTTAATYAAKRIRRAFSIPRNPFRWSRKFKTSIAANTTQIDHDGSGNACGSNSAITSCVGGGRGRAGSIVSLNSYEAISKDTNGVSANKDKGGGEGIGSSSNSKNGAVNVESEQKLVNGGSGKESGNNKKSNNKENSQSSANSNRILRRSSFRKFLNRIAQHVSTSINVGANKNANISTAATTADRVPPIGGNYQWPADQTPGVMGLKNHGNTCFMNAVLQCLSHTDILAEYFVLDQYKVDLKRRNKINSRKFGTKGELTEQLANVLKALWTCKNESDHSTSFKAVVDRYGSQFRSSTQHDAQEFLFWLLDKVHEDLNTATKRRYKSVKNSYGRPDEVIAAETLANHIRCNNSFVQAVFQAQFRSSLTCPRCKKQSNTFDPFHCISVQLPQLLQQTIFVIVVYLKREPRQVKMGIKVPTGSPIVALREQLQNDSGIDGKHMVLVDINKEGFTRVFYDSQPVATLTGIDTIYCIEVPEVKIESESESASAETEISTSTPAPAPAANVISEKSGAEKDANAKTKTKVEEKSESNETGATGSTANSKTTDVVAVAETNSPTSSCSPSSPLSDSNTTTSNELILLVANVRKPKLLETDLAIEESAQAIAAAAAAARAQSTCARFGTPFSLVITRDCSYDDLQKRLLCEMKPLLKPEVFSAKSSPPSDLFQMRLQDPSADPDTYLPKVEHPLLTEMIDLALSVLSAEAGPPHIKLLLEWSEPAEYFADLSDKLVEDESIARLNDSGNTAGDSGAKVAADSGAKVKSTTSSDPTAVLTLEQCLEHYTKAETLSAEDAWRCPHCQQYLPVVKTLGLWSLPDILVVHFKRFRQHHEKGANAAKLTTMVKFPLNAFDLSPHLARGADCDANEGPRQVLSAAAAAMEMAAHGARPSPWKKTRAGDSRSSTLSSRDNRETRYDLYAVCYHQGDTLETGHYTAACKNPYDRQWYKFDDQRVSKVANESIEEEIINNEAYMLFYQRRNGDAAECSGSSSNSGDHWVSRIAPPPTTQQNTAAAVAVVEEKIITATKAELGDDEDIKEDRKDVVVVATAATIEPIPAGGGGGAEETSVDITNVKNISVQKDDAVEEANAAVTKAFVNNEKISVDIETLDFVDADAAIDVDVKDTNTDKPAGLAALPLNPPAEALNVTIGGDNQQVFVMDEDCLAVDESPSLVVTTATPPTLSSAKSQKSPLATNKILPLRVTETTLPSATIATITTAVSKSPTAVATAIATTSAAAATTAVLTNGYTAKISAINSTLPKQNSITEYGKPKSPTAATDKCQQQQPTSTLSANLNGHQRNSSNSSSTTSLSSIHHSLPHSLAVSSMQNKLNSFNTNVAAAAATTTLSTVVAAATNSSNYKEVVLSSSLKSNSSSIISIAAVATATSHEFHLNRHQPWNGSRSSVSAVESISGTHATNGGGGGGHHPQHMHGLSLRHSFSTSSNCKLRECSDTLSSMLRNSSNTCSKDTLIFIDQQNHHHHHHHHRHPNHHSLIEDDDDSFMGSRSLWISPVTPHKLITVSPKN